MSSMRYVGNCTSVELVVVLSDQRFCEELAILSSYFQKLVVAWTVRELRITGMSSVGHRYQSTCEDTTDWDNLCPDTL
jgi:hypothetical protein